MSRKLTIHELFDILQYEYIVCILRSKIYYKQHLKEYWERVAESKKNKILDISNKNNLLSIFDKDDIKEIYEKKVYNEKGSPNFYYTSEENERDQGYWDLWNYYYKDSKVKVFFSDKEELEIGVIVKSFIKAKEVLVKINKKDYLLPMSNITRIF